ncbi:MAG: RNA methyltransferase [Bacteroidales bacterium]|nr:RNA methyltransferase [Bacteroidales bacterium]
MENRITSAKIKEIRSLQQKKFRSALSLFVVEGEKMVEEALASGFEVESVWKREEIGEGNMARISSLSSPSPILAVLKQKNFSLSDIRLEKDALYLLLDGVKDPGNLGTIIRLADWFGVSAVFCSEDCVELYNPKTVQATMGAIFRVMVCYAPLDKVIETAENKGIPAFGTFLDGEPVGAGFYEGIGDGGLVVLGSESFGISEEVSGLIPRDRHILIPSYGKKGEVLKPGQGSESLNVATACAAILSLIRAR